MKRSCLVVIALAVATAMSLTTIAGAQNKDVRAVYDASSTVRTNIEGVRTFNAPPAGFNPVAAADEELATYGFPPRPDKQNDAAHYAMWAKAMAAAKTRWNGELRHTGAYSRPARPAHPPAGAEGSAGAVAGPQNEYSLNWSGFVNTNTLTKYNSKSSFYIVYSYFNVPWVSQPSGSCDGGWDWEVSWNGIDGYQDQYALLQGGSSSEAYCSGGNRSYEYYAWIEWWPSYDILEEFYVNPGDDMYVATYDTSATQGYVYLADVTQGIYATYGIQPLPGQPGLIGNSAEYIVERPWGRAGGYYPLANYVWDFWANSDGYTFTGFDKSPGTPVYPGSTANSTFLMIMLNDQESQVISYPEAQGKYGIFFQADGCAVVGGCTP
jgi:hypothetical protein